MRYLGSFVLGLIFASAIAKADVQWKASWYEQLKVTIEALFYVEKYFVDEPNLKQVVSSAIRSGLESLDSHSRYYSPDEMTALRESAAGRQRQPGFLYQPIDHDGNGQFAAVLTRIYADSPADDSGLRVGDRIVEVGGVPLSALEPTELEHALMGGETERLDLLIQRAEEPNLFEVTIVLDWVESSNVKAIWLKSQIALVEVGVFTANVAEDIRRFLSSKPVVRGLILDLQNSPGGLFNEAVEVADLFLPGGRIVSTIGRDRRATDERQASSPGTFAELPLIVLQGPRTASAAEIVVAALKENKRSRIAGQRSYGKGSVQTIFDLSDGSGVKITIAKYMTPSGRFIESQGVEPDDLIVTPNENVLVEWAWAQLTASTLKVEASDIP